MIHQYRIFGKDKFGTSRLIFDKLQEEPKQNAEAKLEAEKESERQKARDEWKKLRENVDESGEATLYLDTFKKSPDLGYFMSFVELEMSTDDPQGFFNFENWMNMATNNPEELVHYFDEEPDIPLPRGKGGKAFIEGLKKPRESAEFQQSYKVLAEMVKFLKDLFEKKRAATADTEKQASETFKGPLVGTVKDGLETLSKNWERATGKEKLAIGAAGLIALAVIWKYKDKKFFIGENTTYQDVFMTIGAGLGINYLLGKMSKDGKTPIQRLDIGRSVDDLSDENVMAGFCEKYKLAGSEEKMRAFYMLQQLSVKELFTAYEDASGPMGARTIDPTRLGFHKNEIDGKAAYEMMDELMKMTSVNEHIRQNRKQAQAEGRKYTPPPEGSEQWRMWQEREYGRVAFRNKYITGEFADLPMTLFDTIINEYHTTNVQEAVRTGKGTEEFWTKDVEEGKKARIPDYVAGKIGEKASAAKAGAKKWTDDDERWGGKWAYEGVAGGLAVARDYTIKPAWEFLKRKVGPAVTNGEVWMQKGRLESVLPGEHFAIKVTETDKANIMGYPGIAFDIEWAQGDITIDGVTFAVDKKLEGNQLAAVKLESNIQAKVDTLLNQKNIAALKGKKPKWDGVKKEWHVEGVSVNGEAALGIPGGQTDVSFTLVGEKPEIKFNIGGRAFENFDNVDRSYRDSKIQKMLWDLAPMVEGMPLEIDDTIQTSPRTIVNGKIAGLAFQAVPHFTVPLSKPGLQFLVNGTEGGPELIKLNSKFAEQAAEFIGSTPDFQTPFFHLESLMDNTDEGAWKRIKQALPWNLPEGVNGKILQRHWKYLLDYKQKEVLGNFARELGNGSYALDKLPAVKTNKISKNLEHLENIAHGIESAANDDERADKFPKYFESVELVDFECPDAQALFKEYKEMFWNERFNYKGVETFGDVAKKGWGGVADEAYQIYQVVLKVWNHHMLPFANEPSLSSAQQEAIRLEVTAKVKGQLEIAMGKGDGTITLENLPDFVTDEDLEKWLVPGFRTGNNGSKLRIADKAAEIAKGNVTPLPEHREKRDQKGSINPTPLNLDGLPGDDGSQPEHGIKKKLQHIYDEVFPLSYSFKFSNQVSNKYKNVLKLLPEAMLMDAITSNGSEEELLDQFRDKLTQLRDKNESSAPWHEVWNVMKDIFRWIIGDKSWDLPGVNPNIGKGPIKPNHKTFISYEMQKIEEYYRERLEDEHGNFGIWPGYDTSAVEFLNEIELPFTREHFLNKAVIEGMDPLTLAANYSEVIKARFRECIKNDVERRKQATDDADETNTRQTNPKWANPVAEMVKAVKP